jgi:hypothetical protein
LEVVESDEQTKRNEKCAGESVSSSSEGLRRSARKTFVASGSYTMKGKQLFQTKDKKVFLNLKVLIQFILNLDCIFYLQFCFYKGSSRESIWENSKLHSERISPAFVERW